MKIDKNDDLELTFIGPSRGITAALRKTVANRPVMSL